MSSHSVQQVADLLTSSILNSIVTGKIVHNTMVNAKVRRSYQRQYLTRRDNVQRNVCHPIHSLMHKGNR